MKENFDSYKTKFDSYDKISILIRKKLNLRKENLNSKGS